jgi:hypothetical protein
MGLACAGLTALAFEFELSSLDGSNGFVLNGIDGDFLLGGDQSGWSALDASTLAVPGSGRETPPRRIAACCFRLWMTRRAS